MEFSTASLVSCEHTAFTGLCTPENQTKRSALTDVNYEYSVLCRYREVWFVKLINCQFIRSTSRMSYRCFPFCTMQSYFLWTFIVPCLFIVQGTQYRPHGHSHQSIPDLTRDLYTTFDGVQNFMLQLFNILSGILSTSCCAPMSGMFLGSLSLNSINYSACMIQRPENADKLYYRLRCKNNHALTHFYTNVFASSSVVRWLRSLGDHQRCENQLPGSSYSLDNQTRYWFQP